MFPIPNGRRISLGAPRYHRHVGWTLRPMLKFSHLEIFGRGLVNSKQDGINIRRLHHHDDDISRCDT
jgi:hypothetical protein